jgi:hypothetical protein
VSSVKYEMGFYIPEDGSLHSHYRAKLKSSTIPIILTRSSRPEELTKFSTKEIKLVIREYYKI